MLCSKVVPIFAWLQGFHHMGCSVQFGGIFSLLLLCDAQGDQNTAMRLVWRCSNVTETWGWRLAQSCEDQVHIRARPLEANLVQRQSQSVGWGHQAHGQNNWKRCGQGWRASRQDRSTAKVAGPSIIFLCKSSVCSGRDNFVRLRGPNPFPLFPISAV